MSRIHKTEKHEEPKATEPEVEETAVAVAEPAVESAPWNAEPQAPVTLIQSVWNGCGGDAAVFAGLLVDELKPYSPEIRSVLKNALDHLPHR